MLRLCYSPPITVQENGASAQRSREGPADQKLMNETVVREVDVQEGTAVASLRPSFSAATKSNPTPYFSSFSFPLAHSPTLF